MDPIGSFLNRFQNTLCNLESCLDEVKNDLTQEEYNDFSESEKKAIKDMVKVAENYAEEVKRRNL